MLNTHAKGLRAEKEAMNILKVIGYWSIKPNWSRWAQKDFWGLFDIIAAHNKLKWKLIQVKSGNKLKPKEIEKIKESLRATHLKISVIEETTKPLLTIGKC
jgi:Holliday junction resolvase-like predicted endonuclease